MEDFFTNVLTHFLPVEAMEIARRARNSQQLESRLCSESQILCFDDT